MGRTTVKSTKTRLIVGLMSGTSHDGVDAALTSIRGEETEAKVTLLHHTSIPYNKLLRQRISDVMEGKGGVEEICALNFDIGMAFAKAAIKCIDEAGISISKVTAIASHGQTVHHIPPKGKIHGSTLQIGDPSVIAAETGLMVVSNFREADMALGGQGAPLVPYADHMLFHDSERVRLVQNIGGIANVTIVTPKLKDIYAFDTGPGNCLMDIAMEKLYGKAYDRGGRMASKGRPDVKILDAFMRHTYFRKSPPKSTGRELFGPVFIRPLMQSRHSKEDIMATLAHLTARSIAHAYERFIFPHHDADELIVCGGGADNAYLMRLMGEYLPSMVIKRIEEFGIPSGAKEAMSFAILANETLSGRPSSLPRVTGASRAAVLGRITPPPYGARSSRR